MDSPSVGIAPSLREFDRGARRIRARASPGYLRYPRPRMTPATPSDDLAREPAPSDSAPAVVASDAVACPTPFVTACQDVLFAPEEPRCDACGSAVHDDDAEGADDTDGGHGLYVWARGGEIVYEEPPLCASCAAAITITALQRWEIEEEEG
jgi:hypothetical protein